MNALFACTKCHSRHPFEHLSNAEQLCKVCQKQGDVVRCIYCRHEFHADEKNGHNAVCKHCSHHLKSHGKPKACDYCKEIAAFVGRKCHRCSHQEKKYGAPRMCERCKNACAFDRGLEYRSNMEGKWLCWLCIVAHKRAKRRGHSTNQASPFTLSSNTPTNQNDKKTSKLLPFCDVINDNMDNNPGSADVRRKSDDNGAPSPKRRKLQANNTLDYFSSEYLLTISQLRESLEASKKQLQQKEQLLQQKDCQITELKAQIYEVEKKTRDKVELLKKSHDQSVDSLLLKMRELQRTLASNKRSNKR